VKRASVIAAALLIVLSVQESSATSILIQETSVGGGVLPASLLNSFYNTQSLTSNTISDATTVTAANLAGINLFVGYMPSGTYTASEIAAFNGFLATGGRILFIGENGAPIFQPSNNAIGAAINALGGTMASDNKVYDIDFHPATIGNGQILPSFFTAGVNTLSYAAPSGITGEFHSF
jgi:hypothetical protein